MRQGRVEAGDVTVVPQNLTPGRSGAEHGVEQGLHVGSAAHAAGLVQGDIFELKTRGLFGHGRYRFLCEVVRKRRHVG